MDAEAEEGEAEVRDVVHVSDHDPFAPHFDSDGAATRNAYLAVVSKGDVLVEHAVVVNKRPVVGPQVVGGAAVEDGDLAGGRACCSRDGSAGSGEVGGG